MQVRRIISSIDPILALILIAASFLLFTGLDHRPLWQDEAETACLARNLLRYGQPVAFDGINIISQEESREFGEDFVWRWSPWGQIYVAATAMLIGGQETAVVRLPFAIAALACIWLTYHFVRSRFNSPGWARLSAALLACNVPFLLYSRQCRYYSIGALLTMLILTAFRSDWQRKKLPAIVLVGSAALLFHLNYLLFFSFGAAFAVASVFIYRNELSWKRVFLLSCAVIVLVVAGMRLYGVGSQTAMLNIAAMPRHIEQYFAHLFQFMLPIPVFVVLIFIWTRRYLRGDCLAESDRERFVLFAILLILVSIAILSPVPQCYLRYIIHLAPVCAIILGWVVFRLARYKFIAAALLATLLIVTNWLHILPMDLLGIANRPRDNEHNMLTFCNIPLRLFVRELGLDYPDSNRSMAEFLATNAAPGDVVMTGYGDLPLQFYTECTVIGGLQGPLQDPEIQPDWIVRRRYTRLTREGLFHAGEQHIRENINLERDYDQIILPQPDERFGNRPDPYAHRFAPPTTPYPGILIYKKKGANSAGPRRYRDES